MDPNQYKRPMASARRVGLFRREIVQRVSVSGFEVLLAGAQVISEGQVDADGRYFGSTMITLDLQALDARLRDACDAGTARRLSALLQNEPALLSRLGREGIDEARRLTGSDLEHPVTEVRVRDHGCQVLVDVDVEGRMMARRREVTP